MEPVVTLARGGSGAGTVRPRRRLDDRLYARFPRLYRLVARAFVAMPPRSRLRRSLVLRQVHSGWAATSRGDFDLVLSRYAPDVEYHSEPSLTAMGLEGSYHGHAGMRETAAIFFDAWQTYEYSIRAVVDLGDRIVTLGAFHASGSASGVPLVREFAQALTLRKGLVVQERDFMDWDAALRTFDLDPRVIDEVPRPTR